MTSLSVFNNSIFRIAKHGYFRQMCTLQRAPYQIFRNPCKRLEKYLEIRFITKEDNYFAPSIESMERARNMFLLRENNIKNVKNTLIPRYFPDHSLPEVAFIGQSNAGKSTILKAVFESSLRIETSKTPGCTKSLKFYSVGSHFCLVDTPGFGLKQPASIPSSVMLYLKNRKNLVKTFLVIDIKRFTWDDAALQMLVDLRVPFDVVVTKMDIVPVSKRLDRFLQLRNILKDIQFCSPHIFMISSKTWEGLGHFQAYIAHITGNLRLSA